MLDGAAEPVIGTGNAGELFERLQVDRHVLPHRTVGVHEAAVGGAGLDADLAEAEQIAAAFLELAVEAVHVGVQLVDV